MTAEHATRLFDDLWALPEAPVGPHLTEETFLQYALQALSPAEVEACDVHLASCLDCATTMGQLLDVADAWHAQQAQPGRGALQAYVRTALATAQQHLVVTRVLVCTAIALARVRAGVGFYTDEDPKHWITDEGVCVLSSDRQGFVFAVDSTQAAYQDAMVRFALSNGETGQEYVTGLLLLHPSRINKGHYVASARLDATISLPTRCQPRLAVVALTTVTPQVATLLQTAVATAATAEDRQAWAAWAQREMQAHRLPPEVAEAIQRTTHLP